jgi:hypothetical protein
MDNALRDGVAGRRGKLRRQFLRDVTTAGFWAVAAASLPARVQEKAEPPTARDTASTTSVTLAETLADFAVKLRYEDLPGDVIRTVKRTILDTIGCAIGGYDAEPSRIAVKLASRVSATPAATVLCSGVKTSHDLAVFANGVMIRYLVSTTDTSRRRAAVIRAIPLRPCCRQPRSPEAAVAILSLPPRCPTRSSARSPT